MLSVPPAAAGGSCRLVYTKYSNLSTFKIYLIAGLWYTSSIVINNAILLVHRTLQLIKNKNMT